MKALGMQRRKTTSRRTRCGRGRGGEVGGRGRTGAKVPLEVVRGEVQALESGIRVLLLGGESEAVQADAGRRAGIGGRELSCS